jgi:hypothetical protein
MAFNASGKWTIQFVVDGNVVTKVCTDPKDMIDNAVYLWLKNTHGITNVEAFDEWAAGIHKTILEERGRQGG